MAMLITKFHKLIQSKLLWISFLVIVVFSFVIWGTQMPENSEQQAMSAPGMLDGEPVKPEVFSRARFNTYLGLVMAVGRAVPVNDELSEQLDHAAWQRIASLREADKLGIQASDQEVLDAIRFNPIFQGEQGQNQFSKANYDAFAQQFLNRMGASKRDFEEHMREEIRIRKLQVILERSLLVTPMEIQRTFHALSDTFTIEYVHLTPDLVADNVEVTEEDAMKVFDENPSFFEVPEKVDLKVVAFAADDYLADIEITDAEVREYYDFNLDEFELSEEEQAAIDEAADEAAEDTTMVSDSEPVEDADAEEVEEAAVDMADADAEAEDAEDAMADAELDTDSDLPPMIDQPFLLDTNFDFEASTLAGYKPFEDVEDEIRATLITRAAVMRAAEAADQYVNELSRSKESRADAPGILAEHYAAELLDIEPITRMEAVDGIDAGEAFNVAAFNLSDDPDYYFSDPVSGTNHVYVLILEARIPKRIPEFEEIKEEATALARENAVVDALNEYAEAMKDEALAAMKAGTDFDAFMETYGLPVDRPEPFSTAGAEIDSDYGPELIRGILTRNPGEISDIIPVEDGILLAYIKERRAGDPMTFDTIRQQIVMSMRRQNSRVLFNNYQDYLLEEADFTPREEMIERLENEENGETDAGDAS